MTQAGRSSSDSGAALTASEFSGLGFTMGQGAGEDARTPTSVDTIVAFY
jgi:hypothetical protein